MEQHQQRVVDEKKDLDVKLERLNTFFGTELFSRLDEGEQDRLRRQANAMGEYSAILGERIAMF